MAVTTRSRFCDDTKRPARQRLRANPTRAVRIKVNVNSAESVKQKSPAAPVKGRKRKLGKERGAVKKGVSGGKVPQPKVKRGAVIAKQLLKRNHKPKSKTISKAAKGQPARNGKNSVAKRADGNRTKVKSSAGKPLGKKTVSESKNAAARKKSVAVTKKGLKTKSVGKKCGKAKATTLTKKQQSKRGAFRVKRKKPSCAVCLGDRSKELGFLKGPYGPSKHYVHWKCASYSYMISRRKDTFRHYDVKSIQNAVSVGRHRECCICREMGATAVCAFSGCNSHYHVKCFDEKNVKCFKKGIERMFTCANCYVLYQAHEKDAQLKSRMKSASIRKSCKHVLSFIVTNVVGTLKKERIQAKEERKARKECKGCLNFIVDRVCSLLRYDGKRSRPQTMPTDQPAPKRVKTEKNSVVVGVSEKLNTKIQKDCRFVMDKMLRKIEIVLIPGEAKLRKDCELTMEEILFSVESKMESESKPIASKGVRPLLRDTIKTAFHKGQEIAVSLLKSKVNECDSTSMESMKNTRDNVLKAISKNYISVLLELYLGDEAKRQSRPLTAAAREKRSIARLKEEREVYADCRYCLGKVVDEVEWSLQEEDNKMAAVIERRIFKPGSVREEKRVNIPFPLVEHSYYSPGKFSEMIRATRSASIPPLPLLRSTGMKERISDDIYYNPQVGSPATIEYFPMKFYTSSFKFKHNFAVGSEYPGTNENAWTHQRKINSRSTSTPSASFAQSLDFNGSAPSVQSNSLWRNDWKLQTLQHQSPYSNQHQRYYEAPQYDQSSYAQHSCEEGTYTPGHANYISDYDYSALPYNAQNHLHFSYYESLPTNAYMPSSTSMYSSNVSGQRSNVYYNQGEGLLLGRSASDNSWSASQSSPYSSTASVFQPEMGQERLQSIPQVHWSHYQN
eukprot:Nk52_evm16s1020 gene=Nk52_evmTU16s1020